MYDVVQIAGSLLILAAFVAALTNRLSQHSRAHLAMNAVGSTVLAVEAVLSAQWGFLLLEGVWAAVSIVSMARPRRRPV